MGQNLSFDDVLRERLVRCPTMRQFLEHPEEFLASPHGPELLQREDVRWHLTKMGNPKHASSIFKAFYKNVWSYYENSGAVAVWIHKYYMRKILEGMLGSVDVSTAKTLIEMLPCKMTVISKVVYNPLAIQILQDYEEYLPYLFLYDVTRMPRTTTDYVLEKVGRRYLNKWAIKWTKKNDTEKLVWAFTKGLLPYLNIRETPRSKPKTLHKLASHRELKLVLSTAEVGYATVWQIGKLANLPLDTIEHVWSFLHPLDVIFIPPHRLLLRQGCKRTIDLPEYYYEPKRRKFHENF